MVKISCSVILEIEHADIVAMLEENLCGNWSIMGNMMVEQVSESDQGFTVKLVPKPKEVSEP